MSLAGNWWCCRRCSARRDLLVVYFWRPPRVERWATGERHVPAFTVAEARCFDRPTCAARIEKRRQRAQVRGSRIDLTEPPGDPAECEKPGHCWWCGEPMYRVNNDGDRVLDKRRGYHRAERGERGCRDEKDRSYTFDARNAVVFAAKAAGETELRCVDCGTLCARLSADAPESDETPTFWEADHELALEDGGEHSVENLRCRCARCHRAKTSAENTARAAARRPPSPQLAMEGVG